MPPRRDNIPTAKQHDKVSSYVRGENAFGPKAVSPQDVARSTGVPVETVRVSGVSSQLFWHQEANRELGRSVSNSNEAIENAWRPAYEKEARGETLTNREKEHSEVYRIAKPANSFGNSCKHSH